jgi:hypothetical protein
LGDEAGRRRIRRAATRATRPGEMSTGAPRTVYKKAYGQQRGSRLPVSGQATDADKMKLAAQAPWTCSCGRQNRYYVFRCRRCGEGRPW